MKEKINNPFKPDQGMSYNSYLAIDIPKALIEKRFTELQKTNPNITMDQTLKILLEEREAIRSKLTERKSFGPDEYHA